MAFYIISINVWWVFIIVFLLTVQYLIKNKNIYIVTFFIFFLLLIYFELLPNFYSLIQPDSYSYINGDNTQKHLYTTIIKTFTNVDNNFDYLINFQKIVLISSILFLFIILSKTNLFLALLFLVLLVFNISYISYSKVVLTESIFFSFLNFFLGFILFYEKTKKEILIYLACFCLGGLYAVKSIGFVITIPFFLIICFRYKKKKKNSDKYFISLFITTNWKFSLLCVIGK